MYIAEIESPFLVNRALRLKNPVDIKKMKAAAEIFIGKHDFTAFRCKGSTPQKTNVRTVSECAIEEISLYGNPGYRLTVSADGFLYKTVRIIAGSLIRAGEGKLTKDDLSELLLSGAEWPTKVTAPPYGLYLFKVEY